MLADGLRMDDHVGYRPALLVDATWTAPTDLPDVTLVRADSPAARDWLQRLDARAVLIRPDRYVFGVARDAASLVALTARWHAQSGFAEPVA